MSQIIGCNNFSIGTLINLIKQGKITGDLSITINPFTRRQALLKLLLQGISLSNIVLQKEGNCFTVLAGHSILNIIRDFYYDEIELYKIDEVKTYYDEISSEVREAFLNQSIFVIIITNINKETQNLIKNLQAEGN